MNLAQLILPAFITFLGIRSSAYTAPLDARAVYTTQLGNVKAEVSYTEWNYKNMRMKITRAGRVVIDQPVDNRYNKGLADRGIGDSPLIKYSSKSSFQLQDFDGDGEPEVILNLHTGGAHCCMYSLIYRYDAAKQQYSFINQFWGDLPYRLEDLDGDGILEFVSWDNTFAYAFSSFASSGFPTQIWRYRQGKMINVTRQFPTRIYENATAQWQAYQEIKDKKYAQGKLAAYLADKYLLGESQEGWRQVQQAYQESDRQEFFTKLRQFLKVHGYEESDRQSLFTKLWQFFRDRGYKQ